MTHVATTFSFCVACAGALLLTGLLRRLSIASALRDLRDTPGSRKPHQAARTQVGGLSVLLAWLVTVTAVAHLFAPLGPNTMAALAAVIPPVVLVSCVGLVDDVESLGAGTKFFVELLAALFLVTNPSWLPGLAGSPWTLLVVWYLGSVVWLVGLTNATNFIDGLDGLAAGVVAVSALGLSVLAIVVGDAASAVLAAATAGVCLGFLRSNISPARVFLGDTGSLFLGLTLAATGLRIFSQSPHPSTAVCLVLLHFIACGDLVFAIVRRSYRGVAIWRADDGHLHHRLVRAGLAPRHAVISLWVLAALGAAAGLATYRHSFERVWAVALLLATLPVIWAAWRGSRTASDRRRSRRARAAARGEVLAGDRAA